MDYTLPNKSDRVYSKPLGLTQKLSETLISSLQDAARTCPTLQEATSCLCVQLLRDAARSLLLHRSMQFVFPLPVRKS